MRRPLEIDATLQVTVASDVSDKWQLGAGQRGVQAMIDLGTGLVTIDGTDGCLLDSPLL